MKRLALVIILLLALASPSGATIYYVNSAADAGGDGTTTALTGAHCAFKTVAQVNAGSFAAGDSVLFNRGDSWVEQLTVPSSGSAGGGYITFGAYGTGANPVINRTKTFGAAATGAGSWYLYTPYLTDYGFEDYTDGSPNDNWNNWTETSSGTGTAQADQSVVYGGQSSVNMTITTANAGGPFNGVQGMQVRQSTTNLVAATQYYLSVWGRVSASGTNHLLNVRVKDNTNVKYLDNAGNWQTSSATIALTWNGEAADTWVEKTITFTTLAGVTSLEINVCNWGNVIGTSWADNVYLEAGSGVSSTKIWTGFITGQRQYYGGMISGSRANGYRTVDNQNPTTQADHTFNGPYNKRPFFWYRDDSGNPGELAIGCVNEGILISSKNYVIIDSIDVLGPGGSTSNTATYNTDRAVRITGTSDHVTIQNLSVTQTETTAVQADSTTSNITYTNLTAIGNASTPLYINAQTGTVQQCLVHDNGRNALDLGDRGGIGCLGGGNITITQNEVYHNGQDDTDCDFEISVDQPTNPLTITRNYVHDCLQGGIQIAEGGNNSLIAYNIINKFGEGSFAGALSDGKFAAIRIGAVVTATTGVHVYNNVITGGARAVSTSHAGLMFNNVDVSSALVKNNIFYNNTSRDVFVKTGATTTSMAFTNNDYYKADYNDSWHWKGTDCDTLAAWKTASSMTETGTLTSDPLFLNAGGSFLLATDFKIGITSPCKEAGFNVGLSADYWGNRVPQ